MAKKKKKKKVSKAAQEAGQGDEQGRYVIRAEGKKEYKKLEKRGTGSKGQGERPPGHLRNLEIWPEMS